MRNLYNIGLYLIWTSCFSSLLNRFIDILFIDDSSIFITVSVMIMPIKFNIIQSMRSISINLVNIIHYRFNVTRWAISIFGQNTEDYRSNKKYSPAEILYRLFVFPFSYKPGSNSIMTYLIFRTSFVRCGRSAAIASGEQSGATLSSPALPVKSATILS